MTIRNISFFLFALLIGFSLIVLAQMSNGQRLYVSPRILDDYRVTIEGERKEMESIGLQIKETEAKIEEYLELQLSGQDLKNTLTEQLYADIALFRLASGSVDMVGAGVEIVIDDGTRVLEYWENPNDILVHDTDLLLIINELKASGAEAISVNGQRIVDGSSISCSGYTVRINGQFYARPFVVRAIGDGSRMSAALIGPGGYGTLLKDWGLVFRVTLKDDIRIPRYEEPRNYRYMTVATATDKREGENN
ncbi:MAG: hypothetical protein CVU86_03650 [Firmicutes bacterium HGW-Firmicutes-11]|jgi:uncharacterized protein YlxW (UPF0749 family)|nr:MAG: hypothetical protein CVU86_03650 [Firmicutes bacterium HGW-Firmicutes-11]